MKARVKATGEIVDVNEFCTLHDSGERTYYWANALELITKDNPDYWTRLEHQYAGQFMQAMISSSDYIDVSEKAIADASLRMAHALVEKLKESK